VRGKNIVFTNTIPSTEKLAPPPEPARNNLPEWYKQIDSFIGGKLDIVDGNPNQTVKKCMPVFDSITSGYLIKLWSDVHVKRMPDGSVSISPSALRVDSKIVEGHPIEQAYNYPFPKAHEKEVLKWINPWHIRTPKGYSTLFISPMHRSDLPFEIMPGVVDTDTFPLSVNFPFFLESDFEGIIPYGTPIAQIIPFKRDIFTHSVEKIDLEEYNKMHNYHDSSFINRYKNKWWSRKEYK
jgi:hypothetical protein